jgi:glycosyltransferase involved in cell wall biosynthesis
VTVTDRRLLVVNTSRSWGGNEYWTVQVAAGMARRGAAVRLLCSSEAVAAPARRAGLDPGPVSLRADGDLPGFWRLRREIARFAPDVLLVTRWRENLHGGLSARLVARPRPRVVMRLGLRLIPRQDLKRRAIFRLVDQVIVNAPEIRAGLLQRPWIAPEKVTVVINGLDLAGWRPRWEPAAAAAGAAFRQRLGVAPGVPLVLAVGSLTPQKDHDGLLTAMARLRADHPDARLAIVGEGFLRPALEAQRRSLALDGCVLLPGFAEDVAAALAAADLLVLSSYNEGMARVLIEAAAAGLPVVATDVSGTRLAVVDGQTGLVVPPRAPERLAAATAALPSGHGPGGAPARRGTLRRRAHARRGGGGALAPQPAATSLKPHRRAPLPPLPGFEPLLRVDAQLLCRAVDLRAEMKSSPAKGHHGSPRTARLRLSGRW